MVDDLENHTFAWMRRLARFDKPTRLLGRFAERAERPEQVAEVAR